MILQADMNMAILCRMVLMVNKVLCFFIGHNYKLVGRSNGDIWGWNNLKCKRCKKKSDTLTE